MVMLEAAVCGHIKLYCTDVSIIFSTPFISIRVGSIAGTPLYRIICENCSFIIN